MENRVKVILRTSIIGIGTNILLALFKILLGTFAHSIAVMLDGINNLSDAGSGIITMIGTALAGRPADRKHPFGYGRMEYLSALIISAIVLYAGITSLSESVSGIIHPEAPDYSTLTLVIIAIAIVVKLALGLFTIAQGKKTNSDSLVASGSDAKLDVFVSTATLVAAIIFKVTGIALEAYLGAIISLVIIKSGIELLRETVSKILGEPADVQLVKDIKKAINEFPEVIGTFDLILNNYGPDKYTASVHVEAEDGMTVSELDVLTRHIMDKIRAEFDVDIQAVGFYSHNTHSPEIQKFHAEVRNLALAQEAIKGFHGFYLNTDEKKMRFDLVVTLDSKNRNEAFEHALEAIRAQYPEYEIQAGMDLDFNEL